MAFSLEALYAFFSPSASRNSSPDGSPSLLSALFSSKSDPPNNNNKDNNNNTTTTTTITKQADGDLPMPSPVESHASSAAPSERDYSPAAIATQRAHLTSNTASLFITRTVSGIDAAAANPSTKRQGRPTRAATTTTHHPSHPAAPPRRSATEIVAPEPLSREFPLPEDEPSLDELLARKPGKWSLGHYVKHARVRRGLEEGDGGEELAQQRQRELEDAKKELLRAKEEMELLVKGRMGL